MSDVDALYLSLSCVPSPHFRRLRERGKGKGGSGWSSTFLLSRRPTSMGSQLVSSSGGASQPWLPNEVGVQQICYLLSQSVMPGANQAEVRKGLGCGESLPSSDRRRCRRLFFFRRQRRRRRRFDVVGFWLRLPSRALFILSSRCSVDTVDVLQRARERERLKRKRAS